MIQRVADLMKRINMECLEKAFDIRVEKDNKYGDREFIQVTYWSKCVKSKEEQSWHGRKWYLSEHMTDDEIIKTAYAAFKAAVEHEIMEGFKVDGKILFNPHVNFEELLSISNQEVKRN